MGLASMMLALVAQFIGAPQLAPNQGTGGPRVAPTRPAVTSGLMVDHVGRRAVWLRHREARGVD